MHDPYRRDGRGTFYVRANRRDLELGTGFGLYALLPKVLKISVCYDLTGNKSYKSGFAGV